MQLVFKRIQEKKAETKKTWDQIAKEAHIKLRTWMTGIPTCSPTDEELMKLAPVLNTTYEYLKEGK